MPVFLKANLPLISIVIPSYNQGRYIERTILSVLRQNYPHKEIIVADGASTDETVNILKRYPEVIWFSEPDRGYADAVNKGLDRAKGEIIGIQSSDDYYNRGAFKRIVGAFFKNPHYGMVTGGHVTVDEDLNIVSQILIPNSLSLRRLIGMETGIFQDATFIRRHVLEDVGPLNIDLDFVADYDLWIRILSRYRAIAMGCPISFYLLHKDQRVQSQCQKFAEQYPRMIRAWMRSSHFPPEFKSDISWIEAAVALNQANWLNRMQLFAEAHEKLKEAEAVFPESRQWLSYKRLSRDFGLPASSISKSWRTRNYTFSGAMGMTRSYLERYKWKFLKIKRILQYRTLDAKWVY